MREKKISFYEYASKYSTQIPIIQRDYAQGREGKEQEAVLLRFLKDLSDSLDKDIPLSLNFIYGIEESRNIFLPIDGQQRLTTLFLLHWFVALRIKKLDIFLGKIELFTYQTRSSAIDFFSAIQPKPDTEEGKNRINELYLIESGNDIKNFPWFKIDWSYDQTVKGVINALNKMFKMFTLKNLNEWWEKLISKEKRTITFLRIIINNTENNSGSALKNEAKAALTYIKMNARGKNLSNFENAKALLHSLGKDGENFVYSFDNKYIRSMEIIINKNEKVKDIGKISHIINEKMEKLLINLFNDLLFSMNKPLHDNYTVKDYLGYKEKLNGYQENRDINKDSFYRQYFDVLNKIFKSEIINTEEFYKYASGDDKPDRLDFCLLLFYFYYNGNNVKFINEWKYLLNNFHISDDNNTSRDENYKETLFSLNSLSKEINLANVSHSPILYMSQKPECNIFDKIPSVKNGDWKEEYIKSKIINEKKLDYNYYNNIESNFDRRIRTFLFMSGFWTGTGNKEILDSYIGLSNNIELNCNGEIPMALKKMYYIIATGFDGTIKSNFDPNIDLSIFNWLETDEIIEEKLKVLSSVYDYIIKYSLNSIESIEKKIIDIAQDLHNKSDWRSFALMRNRDELFYHLEKDTIKKSKEESQNIFEYVKQLDVNGGSIKGRIYYQSGVNLGAIGTNSNSNRTITYQYNLNVNIIINNENASQYTFYTNSNTLFQIYRYIGLNERKHQFEVLEFDITKDLENYINIAGKIKEMFIDLPAVIKTNPIYHHNYSELKKYCEDICGGICEIDVTSYYNTIITIFNINIDLDISKPEIIRKTELLCL